MGFSVTLYGEPFRLQTIPSMSIATTITLDVIEIEAWTLAPDYFLEHRLAFQERERPKIPPV